MKASLRQNDWLVYMARCSDGSLYTGITKDIHRRLQQHATGRGARYFRGRAPQEVVYLETGHSHSSAAAREREIKCLDRAEKDRLIASSGGAPDLVPALPGTPDPGA